MEVQPSSVSGRSSFGGSRPRSYRSRSMYSRKSKNSSSVYSDNYSSDESDYDDSQSASSISSDESYDSQSVSSTKSSDIKRKKAEDEKKKKDGLKELFDSFEEMPLLKLEIEDSKKVKALGAIGSALKSVGGFIGDLFGLDNEEPDTAVRMNLFEFLPNTWKNLVSAWETFKLKTKEQLGTAIIVVFLGPLGFLIIADGLREKVKLALKWLRSLARQIKGAWIMIFGNDATFESAFKWKDHVTDEEKENAKSHKSSIEEEELVIELSKVYKVIKLISILECLLSKPDVSKDLIDKLIAEIETKIEALSSQYQDILSQFLESAKCTDTEAGKNGYNKCMRACLDCVNKCREEIICCAFCKKCDPEAKKAAESCLECFDRTVEKKYGDKEEIMNKINTFEEDSKKSEQDQKEEKQPQDPNYKKPYKEKYKDKDSDKSSVSSHTDSEISKDDAFSISSQVSAP